MALVSYSTIQIVLTLSTNINTELKFESDWFKQNLFSIKFYQNIIY